MPSLVCESLTSPINLSCKSHVLFLLGTTPIFAAKSPGEPGWQAIHDLVKNISETMMTSLPTFWKISKSFMDGKLKKECFSYFDYPDKV